MERIFVFLKSPSAGSTILLGATLIGVLLANTALAINTSLIIFS